MRDAVTSLALTFGAGVTVTRYFRMPPHAEWGQFLQPRADLAAVTWATIHEAKGSEHGAVCVVIPPGEYTEQLVAAWENRTDSEPKRVIYVGVTRAESSCAWLYLLRLWLASGPSCRPIRCRLRFTILPFSPEGTDN